MGSFIFWLYSGPELCSMVLNVWWFPFEVCLRKRCYKKFLYWLRNLIEWCRNLCGGPILASQVTSINLPTPYLSLMVCILSSGFIIHAYWIFLLSHVAQSGNVVGDQLDACHGVHYLEDGVVNNSTVQSDSVNCIPTLLWICELCLLIQSV